MAIATALLGFNDLGRSVTPTFLFRNSFFTTISTLSKTEQKINVGSLKKIEDFCPLDMESCHLAAARRVKLWSVNANFFFEEPHQLAENISLQSSNCNILRLAATVVLATEARFTQIKVFFRACSFQNEVGDPQFFYISDITNSSSFNGRYVT